MIYFCQIEILNSLCCLELLYKTGLTQCLHKVNLQHIHCLHLVYVLTDYFLTM